MCPAASWGMCKGRGRVPEGRLMWLPPSRSLSRRLRLKLPLRLRTLGFSWLSWHMSRCSSRSTMSISRSASSCSRRRSCSSWKRCSCAARSSSSSRLRSSWGAQGRLQGGTHILCPWGWTQGHWICLGPCTRASRCGANCGHHPTHSSLARAGDCVSPKKGVPCFFSPL